MDPAKVRAVSDWPTPVSRKVVQQFLGFTNFYRRFIRNFGQVAALTSTRNRFEWSAAAQAAFDELKNRFVTAPILVTPDPTRQFVVEVDASEVGVGAVLSQSETTMSAIGSCWQCGWLWESGVTGWRALPFPSLCGPTIGTWNTFGLRND
ncbi:uncharacterized protein LOC130564019 [Triplophysa rosa]|uniref:uncharacterized protein LOC130564019 n=1 Tax=Triplophysa rosa TaxID=992332 RepID=UPI002545C4BF|nr:uncharacterized protein LOC130564019 [Triplophysa rosa]